MRPVYMIFSKLQCILNIHFTYKCFAATLPPKPDRLRGDLTIELETGDLLVKLNSSMGTGMAFLRFLFQHKYKCFDLSLLDRDRDKSKRDTELHGPKVMN